MRKLITILIFMLITITSFSQNMIHQHVDDIKNYYKKKGVTFQYKPIENDEVVLVVELNEYGGSEMIYINANYYCYAHLYFYKGNTKMKEFKKMITKKGLRISDEQIENSAILAVKDSVNLSSSEKELLKTQFINEFKKDRYYRIKGVIKIEKNRYININNRLIWNLEYKDGITIIRIY